MARRKSLSDATFFDQDILGFLPLKDDADEVERMQDFVHFVLQTELRVERNDRNTELFIDGISDSVPVGIYKTPYLIKLFYCFLPRNDMPLFTERALKNFAQNIRTNKEFRLKVYEFYLKR